ncbi:MAG TPA: hypothetical protein DEG69_13020 [Flavobacteriaceae bacterium]|nr:hypothetical protein [Flavobacteriaceae bacterium]|tara:strand:+ start:45 stop:551 length:507 start_codon:yes stop_codon:yes gene_type:complete
MKRRKNKKLKVSVSLPRLSSGEIGLSSKESYEKMVSVYLARLNISKRLQNTLSIKVHIRRSVLKTNTLGSCTIPLNGSKASKSFKIVLSSKRSFIDQLQTLAHELCHVAQQVTGRLQCRVWSTDNQTHVRWEGKELGVYLKDVAYEDAPWEHEATKFAEEQRKNIFRK